MKNNPQIHHRHSIRLKGYDYSQAGAYFVTICAWQRECLFGEVVDGEMHLSAMGKIVQWEWMRLGDAFPHVELGEFVIMPNHIHGIIYIHPEEGATRHEQNLPIYDNHPFPDNASPDIVGSPLHETRAPNVGATHADLSMPNSGTKTQSNVDMSGTDGSPRRWSIEAMDMEWGDESSRRRPTSAPDMEWDGGSSRRGSTEAMDMEWGGGLHETRAPNVGATHAGLSIPNSGTETQSNVDMSGTDGSPRCGPTNAPNMELGGGSPRRGPTDAPDTEFPAGDIESHAAERATRHEQNLPIYDNHPLPDDASSNIVGSPLPETRAPHVGATHAGLSMPNSGLETQSNVDISGTDGSPRHGPTNAPDMQIPTGSPRHGPTNPPDMQIPAVDGVSNGPGRATRYEQNFALGRPYVDPAGLHRNLLVPSSVNGNRG